ncbi:protein unc-13 homolog 4B isoform X2 [Toxorhynchites rutilus septentrionalis]|uniref:protein unc-13 homolog 4B isoform X2 n=1 Tax=Toxorhynchites rutilus septentrionalis TaxID=329112 RepID=UPI002479A354|nr:protein unc-13 homolog 4B isoform X2 [Toxorhynchites rutilus septentrionalis]
MKNFLRNSEISANVDNGSSSMLFSPSVKKKHNKFKASLSMVRWMRGNRPTDQNKSNVIQATPCCGLITANDKEIQTQKEFLDKSVQCNFSLDDNLNYRSQHLPHQGITIGSINERLNIINENHHYIFCGMCNCCGMEVPMSHSLISRSPLDDARRRSLDHIDSNKVNQYRERPATGVAIGNDLSNDPPLFRKNNLFSRENISETWKTHKNRSVHSATQSSRKSMLNHMETRTEDQSFSKKYAQRKIGRVNPFVTPREEDEYEQVNEVNISPKEQQQAYLVLDINDQARRPFKRKICTPFNKRITMPPEHFKWPSGAELYTDPGDYRRSLPIYATNSSEVISDANYSQNAHFIRYHQYPESAIDSNSIMFRSNVDDLHTSENFTNQKKLYSNVPNRSSIDPNRLHTVTPNNSSLYSRLSGSIQNLFVGSRNQYGGQSTVDVRSNYSKSENNLHELSRRRGARDRLIFFGSREKVRQRRSNNFLTSGGGSFFTYNYDEEEESNWKKYFSFKMNLLRKHRWGSKNQMDPKRIQDLDGSFFEKFGSILRQKSEVHEEGLAAPLEPFPEESAEETYLTSQQACPEDEDAANETLPDSDYEEQQDKQNEFIGDAFGWNIEELYEEILFEILNNIGCENEELCEESLIHYVQEAFKISNETHEQILEAARSKEPPEICLNVEVIEAKELEPKDSNGLSDPFVTMFIASNPTHRYNTSVKSATLDPLWEEHFSLPIDENANDANLIVEVWDFDPAETVKEKMNKVFDVKGVRGLRKLMKEIAVTASTGKHDNELIGRASIPLKSIPASGLVMWYNLDKKNKLKRQGTIRIRLNFSSQKNNQVAAQEHRHLLRILLLHELETSKVAQYWWSGKFTPQGESVLTQHSAQSSLPATAVAFIQWSVYSAIHLDHHLAFSLFDSLLEKIIRPIQTKSASDEELKLFWEATKKLLPSLFSVIRKLRKKTAGDKMVIKMLTDVLNILAKISMLTPPDETDLFPVQQYAWIRRANGNEPSWDIREALNSAVVSGAENWLNGIKECHFTQSGLDEDRLQNLIKIIQLVRSDIQRSIEYYDKLFQEIVRFQYTKELYITYELKLAELIKPTVEEICRSLKRIDIPEASGNGFIEFEDINMGTTLFELYLVLKRFSTLGPALSPGESNFAIDEYHRWFTGGVTHWLDISVYKALTRIHKAIELDKLHPVDETVKYSSSAVDTLAIFYQIKIFWQQLAWPDIEGAYIFVAKIVDDICRCCVFYADRMSTRVENLGVVEHIYEKKFEVTQEWCLAINNIDYIRQSLKPFASELGVDDIIAKLGDVQSPIEAERCAETLRAVLENAIDTERNKILDLVEKLAKKMAPAMRRFLVEGAELLQQDSNSMDRLMMYMEESLAMLNSELNETNFERVLDAIWSELTTILYDLIQSNLDKRRPPAFFANLRDTLHIMVANFKTTRNQESEHASDKETLVHIERLLQLHGYETTDLIHQYYIDRLQEQEAQDDSEYGVLAVQCFFKDNILELEIMNARNLKPMDSNGSCDSFVRVHFIPEERFVGVIKPRTQSHSKTLFPLYDEKFIISFTPEQRAVKDAIILFSVKDKDLFGMSNQYLAECYLSFNDIANIASETGKIEQKHLKLTRPTRLDTDSIRALEYRQGDKQARDFIKKLRQKMGQ